MSKRSRDGGIQQQDRPGIGRGRDCTGREPLQPELYRDAGHEGSALDEQVTEYEGSDADFPDTGSYGERLLRLFVQVLLVKQPHPLAYFAEQLELPKSTVHRMMKEIEKAGYVVRHRLVGDKYEPVHEDDEQPTAVFYKLSGVAETSLPPKPVPPDTDLDVLRMSAAFSEHLVGKELMGRAETALNFMDYLTKQGVGFSGQPFSAFRPGTIDYSGHRDGIIQLIDAIKQQKVCKVTYKSPWRDKPTTFHIQPLKIFCNKDALYLYARKVMGPGERPYVEPAFQPLLAIHRIEGIEKTTKRFPYDSGEFDWERLYNTSFGVIKGE